MVLSTDVVSRHRRTNTDFSSIFVRPTRSSLLTAVLFDALRSVHVMVNIQIDLMCNLNRHLYFIYVSISTESEETIPLKHKFIETAESK